MSKLINADDIVLDYSGLNYISPYDFVGTAEYFANQIKRMQPIDAIPTEWIREQIESYTGMESAMWGKLLRMWREEHGQTTE